MVWRRVGLGKPLAPTPPPSLDMFAEEVTEGELETPTPAQREGKIEGQRRGVVGRGQATGGPNDLAYYFRSRVTWRWSCGRDVGI